MFIKSINNATIATRSVANKYNSSCVTILHPLLSGGKRITLLMRGLTAYRYGSSNGTICTVAIIA